MGQETLKGTLTLWVGSKGQIAFYRQTAQSNQIFTDEIEPLYGDINESVLIIGENKIIGYQ
ncbi:hypothetical protein [Oceanobacillus massiliensis]|uniref:hypothetical protein n=1 Tax=Oceanobacillus massiliensis TaxID=1465765 RepID=UPI00028943EA|nr:hypothetical protein [Oceanobacillus massiliensis]